MAKKVTIEKLTESYMRLINHLVARRQFPQKDLDHVLEPLEEELKAGHSGLKMYGEEKKS